MSTVNENILAKIQKIRALIERGEGGEVGQAKRTLEKILEKYDIDLESIEEKEQRQIPHAWEMREFVSHVAWALDLKLYKGGRWRDKLYVDVTPSEWKIFNEVLSQVKKIYLQKKKQLMKTLEGYMTGFLDMSYPVSKKDPVCPSCGEILSFSLKEFRWVCNCGYKGKKVRVRHFDYDSYMKGQQDSGRLLTHHD